MAKAITKIVTEEVTVTKKVPRVTLDLSIEEARSLRSVLRQVSGSPEDTYRKYTDAVEEALLDAGVMVFVNRFGGVVRAQRIDD